MKKYIVFFCLLSQCFNFNNKARAQGKDGYTAWSKYEDDTLQYLNKNFVEKRAKFIGKPLRSVLDATELPVKCCIAPRDHTCENIPNELCPGGNRISLLFSNKTDDKDRFKFTLYIQFQPLTNVDSQVIFLRKRKSLLEWSKEEETYYSKFIIRDIELVKQIGY